MLRLLCRFVLLMLLSVAYAADNEEITPLEQYQKAQQHSLAVDKRITARQAVNSSNDEETLIQAYEDLLRFSSSDEQKADALVALDSAIGRANPETNVYRQGMLTKGKLLKRLGRDDESLALFQDAIQNKWLHAMWRYSESLIDAGELDKACQLEYKRVIGKGDYAYYRADKEDFFIFITLLRLMKSDNPDASAMELVFPALEDSTDSPQAKSIAQALCLVQDGQYDDAITLLKEVDIALTQSRESNNSAVVDEYRNTPLYLTAALLFQGTDLDTSREAYGEFIKRNDGNWKHIYDRSMRVVRDLTFHDLFKKQIVVITAALFKSPIFIDENIKNSFSDSDIAAVFELHAYSLRQNGLYDQAFQLREQIIKEYFPHTLPGAMCALHHATALRDSRNLEASKTLALRIVNECNYREAIPWAKQLLSTLAYREGDYEEALELINETLSFVGPDDKGEYKQGYLDAIGIKKSILNKLQK